MTKAILKKPGEEAVLFVGDPSYEFVSEFVGGYIQAVPIGPEIDVYCHEEGVHAGEDGGPLPHNAAGFIGPILILATNSRTGEWRSMTDEEIRKGLAYLATFKDCRHPALDGDPCMPCILMGDDAERAMESKTRSTLEIWESL